MDLLSPRRPSAADLEIREQRRSLQNVSRAIIDTRIGLGLSQEELGRRAGTKQSRVSEIEAMKGNPRFDTLDRIARALDLMVDLVPRRGQIDLEFRQGGYVVTVEAKSSETSATRGPASSPPLAWRNPPAVLVG